MAQSLSQATKKANLSALDNLGTSKNEFEQVSGFIELALGNFIERVKKNIQEAGLNTTGHINDIEIITKENEVQVSAPNYLLYLDRGVSGVQTKYDTPHAYTNLKPPLAPFVQWIKTKNIQLRDEEKYKGKPSKFAHLTDDQKVTNAAWAMVNNTYNHGIKPKKIYSREIPQLIDDLKSQLTDFAIQQINQTINVKPNSQRVIIVK